MARRRRVVPALGPDLDSTARRREAWRRSKYGTATLAGANRKGPAGANQRGKALCRRPLVATVAGGGKDGERGRRRISSACSVNAESRPMFRPFEEARDGEVNQTFLGLGGQQQTRNYMGKAGALAFGVTAQAESRTRHARVRSLGSFSDEKGISPTLHRK